jgi:phosphoglycolate phosphatase
LGHDPIGNDADLEWCIGPPLRESFATLLNTSDPNLVERAVELYRARYATVGLYENTVYEGIPAALADFVEAGFRLFVATSKPTVYAERILTHFSLSSFFERVYGCELDGRLGDKPELLSFLLRTEELSPRGCLMIGDRKHDVLAAKANGLAACGVLWGYGSRSELVDAGADLLCQLPLDLPEHISSWAQREAPVRHDAVSPTT